MKVNRSLTATVIRPILLFSALAMSAQLIGVVAEYLLTRQELARHVVEKDADALFAGVRKAAGKLEFQPTPALHGRYGLTDKNYLTRLRTTAGALIYTNCPDECPLAALPSYTPAPDFWMTDPDSRAGWRVYGGKAFRLGDATVIVDIAILEDRAGVFLSALLHEVVDHMALPMTLMLVVVVGASYVSIRRALAPVEAAADLAGQLDPSSPNASLPIDETPREIAALIRAVNANFRRAHELLQAQKIFTSAISHEFRTPIAIARLELEKIADPRARRVEEDLEALTRLVEQLTTLARLETVDLEPPGIISPIDVAEAVVSALAPMAIDTGRSIELIDKGGESFFGRCGLVENALRNLIENAIRHTAPGARITVEVGPGPLFRVRDVATERKAARGKAESHSGGLGLKIVGRIAETQGGSFSFEPASDGCGSVATLSFGVTGARK